VSILTDDLEKAVAKASFFPVLPVCSTKASRLGYWTSSSAASLRPRASDTAGVHRPALPARRRLRSSRPLLAEVVRRRRIRMSGVA
jgi:hypothetical protein